MTDIGFVLAFFVCGTASAAKSAVCTPISWVLTAAFCFGGSGRVKRGSGTAFFVSWFTTLVLLLAQLHRQNCGRRHTDSTRVQGSQRTVAVLTQVC